MPINLEDLAQNCQALLAVEGSCIRFPGGAKICFNFPTVPADNGQAVRGLLAQASGALAPLQPIFTIIDAVLAVIDCVQGVPEAIIKLDPSKLIECIPNLAEKLAALAALVPQLSLVALLADLIDVITAQLTALQTDVLRIAAINSRILAAEAAAINRPGLALAVNCARSNLDVEIDLLNSANEPLLQLIGVVFGLLEVIGVQAPELGDFEALTADTVDEFLAPISALIDTLTVVREAIPIPPG